MSGDRAEELPGQAADTSLSPARVARTLGVVECDSCARGFHSECDSPCCCSTTEKSESTGSNLREYKDDVSVSAGRKRAAELWHIDPAADCEWRGLANCGGGLRPILGCVNGKQKERQHGPDKDTRNNNPDNMHLICAPCHHIWHALNDPVYNQTLYRTLPHEPRLPNEFEQKLLEKDMPRADICKLQGWEDDDEYPPVLRGD